MNLSEIMAVTGGSAGIIVLFAVAVTPWLAAHAQTAHAQADRAPSDHVRPGATPERATPPIPFPRRPLEDCSRTAAVEHV